MLLLHLIALIPFDNTLLQFSTLKIPYILTGAGILILIGAVIAILMILSKKKKEEQEK